MTGKKIVLLLSLFTTLILFTACEKPVYQVSLNFSGVAGTANGTQVKARLYDSSSRLIGVEPSGAALNSGSGNFTLRIPDGSGSPTGSSLELEAGKYLLHVALNTDADAGRDFKTGAKVNFFPVQIETSDVQMKFSSLTQFYDPVNPSLAPLTASGPGGDGTLYCFWFDSGVELYWGSFSNTQILSITTGSFSGGSGTADTLYGNWFGPVPGRLYNVYCFVDSNANSMPDYALEYHGRIYGTPPTSSSHVNLQIFIE